MKLWGKQEGKMENRRGHSLLQTYLVSLMSLCLSVCMLLGTTMAWFTSGVEVPENEIYVGKLDVDLLLKNAEGKNVSLKGDPDARAEQPRVFDDGVIWFPDHVEVRNLTVVNEGEIPFTYRLGLSAGTDAEGNFLDLDRDKRPITDKTVLENFRSQFNVYVKHGEETGKITSQDLADTSKWTLIGNLHEIYTGELSIFTGESEKLEEVEVDGKKQHRSVYAIAVQMKGDPEYTSAEFTPDSFQGYKLNFNIKLVANQLGAPEKVKDEGHLAALLDAGRSAVLTGDLALTDNIALKYGVLDGGKRDGMTGVKLTVPADTGYDCGILTHGGTIRNLIVSGTANSSRAIGSGSTGDTKLTRNLYIDNVLVDCVQYAINGSGNGSCKVVVTNSEIYGWISYAGLTSFDFVNCVIGKGNSYDGYMVVYGNTSFNGCTFERFDFGGADTIAENTTVTLTDCIYMDEQHNEVKVTAENFKELFMYPGDDVDFNKLKACTILVDGVKVDTTGWASAN